MFRDSDTDKRREVTGYEVHIELKEQQNGELPNTIFFGALLVIISLAAVLQRDALK